MFSETRPKNIETIGARRFFRFDFNEVEKDGVSGFEYLEVSASIFQWNYGTLVSAIIRAKYTADDVEAILLNRGDDDPDHEAQYEELQQWRKHAKELARGVIKE